MPRYRLDPTRTTWHITFGTYGSRLHGGDRPTVDREHNDLGESFIYRDPQREASERERMPFPPVLLTREQCLFAQEQILAICVRGGWTHRVDSAGEDHIHVLLDIDPAIHGEKARRLIKRWLGEAMSKRWPRPKDATWWAEEGSNKAVGDEDYLNRVHPYIDDQRTR